MSKQFARWMGVASVGLLIALFALLWQTSALALPAGPEQELLKVRERLSAAGSYRMRADVEQQLTPRATSALIGQQEQQRRLSLDGAVVLPDRSTLQVRQLDNPAARAVTLVNHAGRSFVLQGDKLVAPPAEQGGLPLPAPDLLTYLGAATDVTVEPVASEAGGQRYRFRIDGARLAELLREQQQDALEAQGYGRPRLATYPQVEGLGGSGELWLGKNGLPLRQQLDLSMPNLQGSFDARIKLDIHFSDVGAVEEIQQPVQDADGSWRAAIYKAPPGLMPQVPWTPLAFVDLSQALRVALGLFGVFGGCLALVALLILLRRRPRRAYLLVIVPMVALLGVQPGLPPGDVGGLRAKSVEAAEQQKQQQVAQQAVAQALQQQQTGTVSPTNLTTYTGPRCGDGAQSTDTDEDGLSDFVENCLGTDPESLDSDSDLISDKDEVDGFMHNGQKWTSDPLKPDTNGDGILDLNEWPKPFGTSILTDTNANGTPDLWDEDNDGDGVIDELDISPLAATDYRNSVELRLDGQRAYDGVTYIDFQLQLEDSAQLRYSLSTLDWPLDTAGQVSDLDNSPADVRLIPMLEMTTTVTSSLLHEYGIIAQRTSAGRVEKLYVPLETVERNGKISAFQGKLAFAGNEANGLRATARLIWLSQAEVDNYINCRSPNQSDATNCSINREDSIIQIYPGSRIRLTGLEVSRSRDVETALFATPGTPTDDAALGKLLIGLNNTFMEAERLEGQAPNRRLLPELLFRFQQPNTPVAEKFYITETVVVETQRYVHIDAAISDLVSSRVPNLLDSQGYADQQADRLCALGEGVQAPCGSLAIATEYQSAQAGLTAANGATVMSPTLSFTLDSDDFVFETFRSLRLGLYAYENSEWRGLALEEAIVAIDQRYDFDALARDSQDELPGVTSNTLKFWTYAFYLNWITGRFTTIRIGENLIAKQEARTAIPALNSPVRTFYRLPYALMHITQGWGSSNPQFRNMLGDKAASSLRLAGISKLTAGSAQFLLLAVQTANVICGIEKSCNEQAIKWSTLSITVFVRSVSLARDIQGIVTLNVALRTSNPAAPIRAPQADFKNLTSELSKGSKVADQAAKASSYAKWLRVLFVAGLVAELTLIGVTAGLNAKGAPYYAKVQIGLQAAFSGLFSIGIFALMFVPGGQLVASVLLFIDAMVMIATSGKYSIATAIAQFFYDVDILSELTDLSFVGPQSTGLRNPERGLVSGNRLFYNDRFRLTFKIHDEDADGDTTGRGYFDASSLPNLANAQVSNGPTSCLRRDSGYYDLSGLPRYIGTRKLVCENEASVEFDMLQAKRNLNAMVRWWADFTYEYEECGLFAFCSEKEESDSIDEPDQTFDFTVDVLPNSVGGFWNWGEIVNLDPDADGLNATQEQVRGTSASNWDSDGDGIGDGVEAGIVSTAIPTATLARLVPTAADGDRDGLNDSQELRVGTRPDLADTDGDGLLDGQEAARVVSGTLSGGWDVTLPGAGVLRVFSDPLDPDADGDGLNDGVERQNASSPVAYNDAPALLLGLRPVSVAPDGRPDTYLRPGDALSLTLQLAGTGQFPVTTTLALCLPGQLSNIAGGNLTRIVGTQQRPGPARQGPTSAAACANRYAWSFAGNETLLQGDIVSTTFTARVDPAFGQSATLPLSASLDYRSELVAASTRILVDADAPTALFSAPADGAFLRGQSYVVGGTANDVGSWVERVEVNLPGTAGFSATTGISPWAKTWTLPNDGEYTLQVRATDGVGRVSAVVTSSVTVDNTPPKVATTLVDGAFVTGVDASGVLTLTGSALDNLAGLDRLQISLDGQPWRELELPSAGLLNHNWSYRWVLADDAQGEHTMALRAFDRSGNQSDVLTRRLVVDAVAPANDLTTRSYQATTPPFIKGSEPLTLTGYVNDAGNVPLPLRPRSDLLGGVATVATATIWLEFPQAADSISVTASWLGDIDGDGLGDLAVGMPNAGDGRGRVSIVYGKGGDWPAAPNAAAIANSRSSFVGLPNARIGAVIAPAGDVNGDGLFDLLIGDPAGNRVFLIFGRPSTWGQDIVLDGERSNEWVLIEAPAGQRIGHHVAAAGNLNGDGFDDLLIAAAPSSSGVGGLFMLEGKRAGDWLPSLALGDAATLRLPFPAGAPALGVGDLNGDRIDDLVLGDPTGALSNTLGAGLYLFRGDASFTRQNGGALLQLSLNARSAFFGGPAGTGGAVAALGDVNGDALADFVYRGGTNEPRLVLGRASGSWNDSLSFGGYGPTFDGFLAAPGDVNADGKNDILIGGTSGRERNAYLFHGSDNLPARPNIAATFTGVASAASAPYAAGADLNCDASSDLLLIPVEVTTDGRLPAGLSYGDLPPVDPESLPQVRDTTTSAGPLGAATTTAVAPPALPAGARPVSSWLYVDDDYCAGCANDGQNWGTSAFNSLSAAVAAASANTQIVVRPGVYGAFTLSGKTNVWVTGVNPDAVFVDGGGATAITIGTSQGGGITGLTLRNSATGIAVTSSGLGGYNDETLRVVFDRLLIQYSNRALSLDILSSVALRRSTLVGTASATSAITVASGSDPAFTPVWSTPSPVPATPLAGSGLGSANGALYALTGNGDLRRYQPGGTWSDVADPGLPADTGSTTNLAGDGDGKLFLLRNATATPGTVNAIATINQDVYVGGSFSSVVNGDGTVVPARNLARWNQSQQRWFAVGDGTEGTVYALAVLGTDLYVGGQFSNVRAAGGSAVANTPNIARWSGSAWNAVGRGVNGPVFALAMDTGRVYVGGQFSQMVQANGAPINADPDNGGWNGNLGFWDGSNWQFLTYSTFNVNRPTTPIRTLAALRQPYASGDYRAFIYAGAGCYLYATEDYNALPAAGRNLSQEFAWYPYVNGTEDRCASGQRGIRALAGYNANFNGQNATGIIVAGDDLERDAGQNNSGFGGIAILDTDGNPSKLDGGVQLSYGTPGNVRALATDGNRFFAGGRFNEAAAGQGNWLPASNIASYLGERVDSSNRYVGTWSALGSTSFPALVTTTLNALARQGTTLYAGGVFSQVNGQTVNSVAAWTGSAWQPLGLGVLAGAVPLYRYDSAANSWSQRNGLFGNLAALTASGNNTLYAAAIGSTNFYRYTVGTDSWSVLSAAPLPQFLGPGTAMTAVAGKVYLLRGGSSRDFFRFDESGNSWTTLAQTPDGFGISTGASLVWDGRDYLYATQGGNGKRFARYNIAANSWEFVALDVPSNVNNGAGLANVGGAIFASAGGTSTALHEYSTGGLALPRKLRLERNAFVAGPVAAASWLSNSAPASQYQVVDDGNNRYVQGPSSSTSWTPAPWGAPGSVLTFDAVRFSNASRSVYRVGAGSALANSGYYQYAPDAFVAPDYGPAQPNDGLTWGQTAFNSIQAAIDAGAQRVTLRAGRYQEPFFLVNGLEVVGSGADSTILGVASVGSNRPIVDAGGVADARIARVTLAGSGGVGLAAKGAALSFSRSIVRGNAVGVRLQGNATDIELANLTFANNQIGVEAQSSPLDVRNSAFAFHTTAALSYTTAGVTILHPYTAFWQNTANYRVDGTVREAPQPGAIFGDPLFSDPAGADFRPLGGSPLLGAGNPSDPTPPGTGGRVDIGYIQQGRAALYVDDDYGPGRANDGLEWGVDAFNKIQEAIDAAQIEVRTTVCGQPVELVSDCPDVTVGVGPGSYNESLIMRSRIRLVGSGADKTIITNAADVTLRLAGIDTVEVAGFTLAATRGGLAVAVEDRARAITLTNLIIRGEANGVIVDGGASATIQFSTLVDSMRDAVVTFGAGSSATVRNSILANNGIGLRTADGSTIRSDFNLLNNTTDFVDVPPGANDIAGQAPGFVDAAGNDYRLLVTSPAVDNADPLATVPAGGGEVADRGYAEVQAIPLALLPGKEGVSCQVGNSGVREVQLAAVPVGDATQPVTATLPAANSWRTVYDTTARPVADYWTSGLTPAGNGLYRLYSRASDAAGNSTGARYLGAFVADATLPQVAWVTPPPATVSAAAVEVVAEVTDYVDVGGSLQFTAVEPAFAVVAAGQVTIIPASWDDSGWIPAAQSPRKFRAFVPVPAGSATVLAAVRDLAGNSGSSTNSATSASTTNVVTLVSPANNSAVNLETLTLQGYARFADGAEAPVVQLSLGSTTVSATLATPGAALSAWEAQIALPADGSHNLQLRAGRGTSFGSASQLTIIRDLAAPALTVTPLAGSGAISGSVTIRGTAADLLSGLNAVELSFDSGCTWLPATVSGGNWSFSWQPPAGADGQQFAFQARARDRAGNTTTANSSITVDTTPPPSLEPVTFSRPIRSYLDKDLNETLTVRWTQPPAGISVRLLVDTVPTTTLAAGDGQPLSGSSAPVSFPATGAFYLHLAAFDEAGNRTQHDFGPWFVGSAGDLQIQIDGEINRASGEWLASMKLDDDERPRPLRRHQDLYAAWDNAGFYLGWQNARWSLDGAMVVYLGSGAGGLTTPLAGLTNPALTLPFAASYAVVISATSSGGAAGTLYEASGGNWVVSARPWRWAHSPNNFGGTELALPFIPTGTPSVRLLALAVANGKAWAGFPTTNPLAGPLSDSYVWSSLSAAAGTPIQPGGRGVGLMAPQLRPAEQRGGDLGGQPRARTIDFNVTNSPALVGPGGTITYVVQLANGEAEATLSPQIEFKNSYGLVYSSTAALTCSDDCRSGVIEVPNLAPDTTRVITITARVPAAITTLVQVATDIQLVVEGQPQFNQQLATTGDGEGPRVDIAADRPPSLAPGAQRVSGSADDGAGGGVSRVELRVASGDWLPANGTTAWSLDLTVPQVPTLLVEARAFDRFGNGGEISVVQFNVDTVSPTVSLTLPELVSGTTALITGTASDSFPEGGSILDVQLQFQEITATWQSATSLFTTTTGSGWRYAWQLPALDSVAQQVRARAVDAAGNLSLPTAWQTTTVDTVAPLLTPTLVLTRVLLDDYLGGAGAPVLSGTVSDGSNAITLTVQQLDPNGGLTILPVSRSGNSWSFRPSFSSQSPLGTYRLQVQAVDAAGNRTRALPVDLQLSIGALAAPRDLLARAQATQVALSWLPPASGVITGYQLVAVSAGTLLTTTLAPSQTSFLDNAVTAGVSVTYQLRALGPAGASTFSSLTSWPQQGATARERDGLIVLPARSYVQQTSSALGSWQPVADPAGGSLQPLRLLPDRNTLRSDLSQLDRSPTLSFPITVTTPGTFTVWARGWAPNGSGDSLYVGLERAPGQAVALSLSQLRTWSWSSRTLSGTLATLTFSQTGVQTITVWMREDGLALEQLQLVRSEPRVRAGAVPVAEVGGLVRLEAEDAALVQPGVGQNWLPTTTLSGSQGSALVAQPNVGRNYDTNLATVPQLSFPVTFTTPGTYTIWARLWAPSGADDSLHVGLNGVVQTSADRLYSNRLRTWYWSNRTMDGPQATLLVTQTGVQTITVWMREDGVALDALQLVLVAPRTRADAVPVAEQDGLVRLEAEDAAVIKAGVGQSWLPTTTLSGSQGSALVAQPNVGGVYDTNLATKPQLSFPVTFTTPGTYTVWARLWAPSGADDSLHVGLNGVVQTSADRLQVSQLQAWHWSSRTMDGPQATLLVTQTGVQTITVWMREDGVALDALQLVAAQRGGLAGAPFKETNGRVVLEAETAHVREGTGGWRWQPTTRSGAIAGGVEALPNVGGRYDNGLSGRPVLSYEVYFSTTGTYRVWARLWAPSGADDSLRVGLNGIAQTNAGRLQATRVGAWHWSNSTAEGQPGTLVVTQPGVQTVTVWMHEDGVVLDRLLLEQQPGYVPVNAGPAASPRVQ